MKRERLVPRDIRHAGIEELSDALLIFAQNIESAFLLAGAVPGEDYTRKDLMEMAVNYAANDNAIYVVETTIYK
jgi:hypothetical protein